MPKPRFIGLPSVPRPVPLAHAGHAGAGEDGGADVVGRCGLAALARLAGLPHQQRRQDDEREREPPEPAPHDGRPVADALPVAAAAIAATSPSMLNVVASTAGS